MAGAVIDVEFDHGAARKAADELRRSAGVLNELLHERALARNSLLGAWDGPAAREHAAEFFRTQAAGHALADHLNWMAGRVDDAALAAIREQRRREEEALATLSAVGTGWW